MGAQTTDEILSQIKSKLPENFETLEAVDQLSFILTSADEVLKVPGKWLLVNGQLTLLELMQNPEPEKKS